MEEVLLHIKHKKNSYKRRIYMFILLVFLILAVDLVYCFFKTIHPINIENLLLISLVVLVLFLRFFYSDLAYEIYIDKNIIRLNYTRNYSLKKLVFNILITDVSLVLKSGRSGYQFKVEISDKINVISLRDLDDWSLTEIRDVFFLIKELKNEAFSETDKKALDILENGSFMFKGIGKKYKFKNRHLKL